MRDRQDAAAVAGPMPPGDDDNIIGRISRRSTPPEILYACRHGRMLGMPTPPGLRHKFLRGSVAEPRRIRYYMHEPYVA